MTMHTVHGRRSAVALALLALSAAAWSAAGAGRELAEALRARPDVANGARLFRQCESCHGGDGNGQVNGTVPRIAGQHFRVLLAQLVDFRHGARADFRMETVTDRHHFETPQQLADVAAYAARMKSRGATGRGDGSHLEQGRRLYGVYCRRCHGADARGSDARAVPRLAGQHYGYLVRQMYDAADGRRPSLSRAHARPVTTLAAHEVRAVSDYLSSLPSGDHAAR
jgi:cytochrome c553